MFFLYHLLFFYSWATHWHSCINFENLQMDWTALQFLTPTIHSWVFFPSRIQVSYMSQMPKVHKCIFRDRIIPVAAWLAGNERVRIKYFSPQGKGCYKSQFSSYLYSSSWHTRNWNAILLSHVTIQIYLLLCKSTFVENSYAHEEWQTARSLCCSPNRDGSAPLRAQYTLL